MFKPLLFYLTKYLRTNISPSSWKHSIIIPIYKGNGKSKSDPTSYRPISLIPCFAKIFEKLLLDRSNAFLKASQTNFPCIQQQGFQKGYSCTTAAFNLQESMHYIIENGGSPYIAFLDIKAAFDGVWHDALFLKLAKLGIRGRICRILIESYSKMSCSVKCNGKTSYPVPITRGVRQGGVLSTFLYLVFIDELLLLLQRSKSSLSVFSVRCGNPTLADDISLIATSPNNLQELINIVYRYSIKWQFSINCTKSCIVQFRKQKRDAPLSLWYGNSRLPETTNAMHLGILQDSSLKLSHRIRERCQKAKNSFHAMIGYGVRPLALNPLTSVSLYKKIVIPTVLYGSELWNTMTKADTDSVNRLQHYIVKRIQGFKTRTRSDMCESMLGLRKLCTEIDKRKLMFLYKILDLPNESVCQQLFFRRYFTYINNIQGNQLGFIPDICSLLLKYNLAHLLNNAITLPGQLMSKQMWKQTVYKAVHNHETCLWKVRIDGDTDFLLFRKLHSEQQPCILYKAYTPNLRNHIDTVARLWVSIPKTIDIHCHRCDKVCNSFFVHIISECEVSRATRVSFLNSVSTILEQTAFNELHHSNPYDFMTIVLGLPFVNNINYDIWLLFLQESFAYVAHCVNYISPEILRQLL